MLAFVSSILMLSAFCAVPDVFWFPAVLTPGKSMSAVPLNDTPPIFLAVCNCVADDALPLTAPENVVAFTLVALMVVNPDNVLLFGL